MYAGVVAETKAIRAELEILKWHADLVKEAVEMRKELDLITRELKSLSQHEEALEKRPPTPMPIVASATTAPGSPTKGPATAPAVGSPLRLSASAPDEDPEVAAIEKAIGQIARNDPTLATLVLNNSTKFDHARVVKLCDALSGNTTLRTLELAHCSLTNDSARRIAAALAAVNCPLRSLNLETNMLSGDGFKAVAEALKKNHVLSELRIANQLQPVGASVEREFSQAVEANHSLTTCGVAFRDSNARNVVDQALSRNREEIRRAKAQVSPRSLPPPTSATPAKAAVTVSPAKNVVAAAATPSSTTPSKSAAAPAAAAATKPAAAPAVSPNKPAAALAAAAQTKTATVPAASPSKPVAAPAASTSKPAPAPAPAQVKPAVPKAVGTSPTPTSTAPSAASPAAASPSGKCISYKELMEKPTGVDMQKLETYLSDKEFETVFKRTRADFQKLPGWRQAQLKKDAKLF